ncbi:MAG: sulfate adenylyltransferase [Actinobacteria bacterium]|jgi:sulfate adenylyltransferase large subunit|uniref:sulfate adenylyltransferase n=1 Tax=freshwater metagenome TaxID=449393 RepID=A0A6J7DDC8_9ZZZZ|nr:sulfate adenylyltransferase [Actinomycetota bacterium]MSX09565.1 sulfate adenylyltransferase [Actinomycetota bacterium]MSX67631.1 sulfate adenylyltransferase [Actinomycetota bacterium]
MDATLEAAPIVDLLRFATIGSVDDGKSTLIGRLLVDTRQLFHDQIEAVEQASRRRGVGDIDLAFVTDGLRAEREQGITIDVAYRYASTPQRKFIIADCPGHIQYTANMATGASNADVALVVVDATAGLKEQTKRHLCIAALLGVRHLIVCANKMDKADWDHEAYDRIVDEMEGLQHILVSKSVTVIPISALNGDNVVEHSSAAPFYSGPTVLEALEAIPSGVWAGTHHGTSSLATRLPVQWILRQPGGGRMYAGMVDGAPLHVGDDIVVLPDGLHSTVTEIMTPNGLCDSAGIGLSISVGLADDLDVSRGDMIVGANDLPAVSNEIEATVCWFGTTRLTAGTRFRAKHTTRTTPAIVSAVTAHLNIDDLTLVPAEMLGENEIGTITLTFATPLAVDDYQRNRITGSFILVDEATNITVAAGMVGPPGLEK